MKNKYFPSLCYKQGDRFCYDEQFVRNMREFWLHEKQELKKDFLPVCDLALTVIDDILDNCLSEVNDEGYLFSGGF